jgi:HK97 family phage major capsid protein
MPMTQEQIDALQKSFVQFKEANDLAVAEIKKYGQATSETTEKVNKLNDRLDTLETGINAKLDGAAKADMLKKIGDRLDELESKINRKGTFSGQEEEQKAEQKFARTAFFKALRTGPKQEARAELTPEEFKALTFSNDPTGGYLAPPEYVMEIITDIVEWSNIRSLARIRTTSRPSIQFPKKTSHASASWVKETGSRDETTNPKWGMEEIATHEMYAMAQVSKQDLEDSLFDLEAFLREEFAEQFGVTEGVAFISGNNVGKPEGLLTNGDIGNVNSGAAASLTADGLINLYYELKEAYLANATWLMSRATLKEIRKMKDGIGNYLWAPGIKSDASPATILDRPYTTAPDMPAATAGLVPILFGDFRRGYLIVDRVVIEMMTDPYAAKKTGMVEFSARKRVGAAVILAEALKKQTVAA